MFGDLCGVHGKRVARILQALYYSSEVLRRKAKTRSTDVSTSRELFTAGSAQSAVFTNFVDISCVEQNSKGLFHALQLPSCACSLG